MCLCRKDGEKLRVAKEDITRKAAKEDAKSLVSHRNWR